MIQVEGLSKRYGAHLAVDDVSFEVKKGEVVGLLGPNGAGKSTTMKILTCYISATSGRASINGFDTFDQPLKVREQIGYLPESCPLYHDMDVTAFLEFCAEIRGLPDSKGPGSARRAAVERVVSDCDLGAVRRKRIGHLSKGYRQRVGIAQALIHNPPVLILDEPTSGLDPNQIRDILGLISNLGQERTVIHSTHILSEVEATSGRVLIINGGRIVAQGTPRDLIARGAGASIHLTVRGAACRDVIASSGFAARVDQVGEAGDGFVRLSVRGVDGRDVSRDLYKLAVEHDWEISELRVESAKLEEVFANLTRG
jgi:ABC-2 type transport system ATP-binding protein